MKQQLAIPLTFLLIVSLIGTASAVMAAPSPTCRISADVINSTYHAAYINCNRIIPASYSVWLNISNVSVVREDGDRSCYELYPAGKEISVKLYNLTGYSSNAKAIEGDIHFGGDECNGGTFLDGNYRIVSSEPEKELTLFQKIISWLKSIFS
ncbi:MAG TPA: hypothetical protein VJA86_00060 [Candidatus Nanoarchaeia archaeon]|nr:hypothetical protein [Candidatus Nanoarchaeia archaeon]